MRRLAAQLTTTSTPADSNPTFLTTSTSADIADNFRAKVNYNSKEPYFTQQKATDFRRRCLRAVNKLLEVNNQLRTWLQSNNLHLFLFFNCTTSCSRKSSRSMQSSRSKPSLQINWYDTHSLTHSVTNSLTQTLALSPFLTLTFTLRLIHSYSLTL